MFPKGPPHMKRFVSWIDNNMSLAILLPSLLISSCGGSSGNGSSNNPQNPFGYGPAAVSISTTGNTHVPGDLGSAGEYVIMAKTGISNVTGSQITGNIAVSPAADSYITGFSEAQDSSTVFATSASVVAPFKIYAATYGAPTPSNLTTAIGSMETAYTNAAGRSNPDFNELSSGEIGGLTLVPGLYKWTNTVTISNNVTISGGPNDVWIFQISGDVTMAANKQVILAGGALAKNIYWQVAQKVDIGTGSAFKGIIFAKTGINFLLGATLQGRAYAQTAVTLNNNPITQPAP